MAESAPASASSPDLNRRVRRRVALSRPARTCSRAHSTGGHQQRARLPPSASSTCAFDKVWTFDAWTLDAYLDVRERLHPVPPPSRRRSTATIIGQSQYRHGLPSSFPTLGLKGRSDGASGSRLRSLRRRCSFPDARATSRSSRRFVKLRVLAVQAEPAELKIVEPGQPRARATTLTALASSRPARRSPWSTRSAPCRGQSRRPTVICPGTQGIAARRPRGRRLPRPRSG